MVKRCYMKKERKQSNAKGDRVLLYEEKTHTVFCMHASIATCTYTRIGVTRSPLTAATRGFYTRRPHVRKSYGQADRFPLGNSCFLTHEERANAEFVPTRLMLLFVSFS